MFSLFSPMTSWPPLKTTPHPKSPPSFGDWFEVAKTFNARPANHIVATSPFRKKADITEGELPPITRDLMMNAAQEELISCFPPWDHYVQPLLDGAIYVKEVRPDVVFRVYLAADLEFLAIDLAGAGCEEELMHSSSTLTDRHGKQNSRNLSGK